MSKPDGEKLEDSKIEMTPLSNGLDFILVSLESLSGKPTDRQVKYGILHLCAGMMLILKERLRREHWSLVFDDIDKADRVKYDKGDFVSVSFDKTVKRLRGICRIPIPEEEYLVLDGLRKQRNQIEHFAISVPIEAAKATAATALGPIIDFITDKMAEPKGEDAEVLAKIRNLLSKFEKYVKNRWKAIKKDVEGYGDAVLRCKSCMQRAMVTADGGTRCLFCGQTELGFRAADRFIEEELGLSKYRTVKDGGTWPVFLCPECDSESCVDTDTELICFDCGTRIPANQFSFCDNCGQPYRVTPYSEADGDEADEDDYDGPVCPRCYRYAVEKD